MKRFFVIVTFILSSFFSMGQEQQVAAQEPADTIVLISGRKIAGMVQGVTTSKIFYYLLDNKELKDIDRKLVHKVLYRVGPVEVFNSLAVTMIEEDDWQTVIITDNVNDVEGLFALGEIVIQSSAQARTARAAKKSAEIRMKKRAVNMGGIVVLITRQEAKGGYGEIPTHLVEGVVYGFEPPVE